MKAKARAFVTVIHLTIIKRCMMLLALCALALLWGAMPVATRAQSGAMGIPARLRPSLNDRLQRFTEAQNSGDWETVASLLGRYRGGSRGTLYTQAHKECLISQMRAWPMVSFKTEKTLFSTELFGTPLAKRWWDLMGTAELRTPSALSTVKTYITAYLDRGQWYFSPPNYDDAWVRPRVTEADLKVDRSASVEFQLDPACPVEIRDLSVLMDEEFLSLRRIHFTLHNKTARKVTGYGLRLGRIGSPCFGMISGVPRKIEPNATGTDREEMTYAGYVFYCEGEARVRLVIDSVDFADGSKWTDPRFRKKGPPKGCLF